MASQWIETDTDQMGKDVQNLRQRLDQARSHLLQLKDYMERMDRMWSGQANQAMRQRFQDDYQAITELCDLFQRMIENDDQAQKNYRACANEVDDIVTRLSID